MLSHETVMNALCKIYDSCSAKLSCRVKSLTDKGNNELFDYHRYRLPVDVLA